MASLQQSPTVAPFSHRRPRTDEGGKAAAAAIPLPAASWFQTLGAKPKAGAVHDKLPAVGDYLDPLCRAEQVAHNGHQAPVDGDLFRPGADNLADGHEGYAVPAGYRQ